MIVFYRLDLKKIALLYSSNLHLLLPFVDLQTCDLVEREAKEVRQENHRLVEPENFVLEKMFTEAQRRSSLFRYHDEVEIFVDLLNFLSDGALSRQVTRSAWSKQKRFLLSVSFGALSLHAQVEYLLV